MTQQEAAWFGGCLAAWVYGKMGEGGWVWRDGCRRMGGVAVTLALPCTADAGSTSRPKGNPLLKISTVAAPPPPPTPPRPLSLLSYQ
eukprot:6017-Chlamydomonas_euryale.AAC.1